MGLGLKYKDSRHIFDERGATVPYLEFPLLRNSGIVNHGFSTRLGGVSEGCFSSMNLSFDRGDRPEAVQKNFRRMGSAIGVECGDMVLSQQTHTTNVRLVTEKDRGKGIRSRSCLQQRRSCSGNRRRSLPGIDHTLQCGT